MRCTDNWQLSLTWERMHLKMDLGMHHASQMHDDMMHGVACCTRAYIHACTNELELAYTACLRVLHT
jgi:hypothetical protein